MPTIVAYPAFKNRKVNPYQALLYTELGKLGWKVYDLGPAVRGWVRPDIVHLHWPEGFVLHRGLLKSLWRFGLFFGILAMYRLLGAKIVWTIHNLRAHEAWQPRLEAVFWKGLYGMLDGWIALNRHTVGLVTGIPALARLPHAVIRHGLYLPADLGDGWDPSPKSAKGRTDVRLSGGPQRGPPSLVCLGQIRPYKNLPELVEAFAGLPAGMATLTIAGHGADAGLVAWLEERARALPGLRVIARHHDEAELADLLAAADMVVIPYAGSLNSGVLFLALGHGVPVLAPRTPAMEEVEEDFGRECIILYNPPLDKICLTHITTILDGKIHTERVDIKSEIHSYIWSISADMHSKLLINIINN
jgi:glycosyltransferase involved in cell wall biosynthesis